LRLGDGEEWLFPIPHSQKNFVIFVSFVVILIVIIFIK